MPEYLEIIVAVAGVAAAIYWVAWVPWLISTMRRNAEDRKLRDYQVQNYQLAIKLNRKELARGALTDAKIAAELDAAKATIRKFADNIEDLEKS